MPPEGVEKIAHGEILSFEEIIRVVRAAASVGIEKIKITGGEPLVRKNIPELIRGIKEVEGIRNVTLTTNGVLFGGLADALVGAGLDAVNFSLDTVDPDKYEAITRTRALPAVLDSIGLAQRMGLPVKINCVPMRPYNLDDLAALAGFAKDSPVCVRFIEMMPIGLGRQFETVRNDLVLRRLADVYGEPLPSVRTMGNGPARYYEFPGFAGSIGLISALTDEFCGGCNRVRLTSEGKLMPCLCSKKAYDMKKIIRSGGSQTDLERGLASFILCKPDRHHLDGPETATEDKNMAQIGG